MNKLFQRLAYGKTCGRIYFPTRPSPFQIEKLAFQSGIDKKYRKILEHVMRAPSIENQIRQSNLLTGDDNGQKQKLVANALVAGIKIITLEGGRLGPNGAFNGLTARPRFTFIQERVKDAIGLPEITFYTIRVKPSFVANVWEPLVELARATV